MFIEVDTRNDIHKQITVIIIVAFISVQIRIPLTQSSGHTSLVSIYKTHYILELALHIVFNGAVKDIVEPASSSVKMNVRTPNLWRTRGCVYSRMAAVVHTWKHIHWCSVGLAI